ncbi:hypothetical protein SAMN05444395_11059 [Flavobacterium fryxellicola]|nr:hypothetical protein SAMN05444395_11059 [Flavobacterium fryxellicola]
MLSYSFLIMKGSALFYNKKTDDFPIISSSGVTEESIEHLIPILIFFESLK